MFNCWNNNSWIIWNSCTISCIAYIKNSWDYNIIISNYLIDNTSYNYLPLNINCSKFSIDIKFICFPKNLIKKLEEIFNNHEIFINKIICSNYAKSFTKNISCTNICECGLKLTQGINRQEVVIVPKKLEKKGFFERLFHFFK